MYIISCDNWSKIIYGVGIIADGVDCAKIKSIIWYFLAGLLKTHNFTNGKNKNKIKRKREINLGVYVHRVDIKYMCNRIECVWCASNRRSEGT